MLKDPSGGDIEFVFQDGENPENTRKLYAFSHVLQTNPAFEFYRIFPSLRSLRKGRNSGSNSSSSHEVFRINHDYDLFHLVLFYLYTDKITFITTSDITPTDMDATSNAEGIYAIAHELLIEPLEKKALHFLQATCNLENITQRTFGRFASKHQAAQKWYDVYFMEHWNEVKNKKEFDTFFDKLEADEQEFIRVNRKFRQMIVSVR
jgi:hypothetical protein